MIDFDVDVGRILFLVLFKPIISQISSLMKGANGASIIMRVLRNIDKIAET
jgi:hypothetical protein